MRSEIQSDDPVKTWEEDRHLNSKRKTSEKQLCCQLNLGSRNVRQQISVAKTPSVCLFWQLIHWPECLPITIPMNSNTFDYCIRIIHQVWEGAQSAQKKLNLSKWFIQTSRMITGCVLVQKCKRIIRNLTGRNLM
jgi:hypothetical protein